MPPKRLVQPAPATPVTPPPAEVEDELPTLVCEVFAFPASSVPCNEVRLHKSSFTKLRARPGDYVRVSGEDSVPSGASPSIVCQAFVATSGCASMPLVGLGLSDTSAALMGGKGVDCVVEPLPVRTMPSALEVTLSASVRGGGAAALEPNLAAGIEEQLAAQLRMVAGPSVMCRGLRWSLVVAGGCAFDVRVEAVVTSARKGPLLAYGLLSHATVLNVQLAQHASAAQEGIDAGDAPLLATPHTLFVGDHGVGKSYALQRLVGPIAAAGSAARLDITLAHVGASAASAVVGLADSLQRLFATAARRTQRGAVVVVVDDLDVLFAAVQTPAAVYALQSVFAAWMGLGTSRCAVVASCTSEEKVPSALRGLFTAVERLNPPSGPDARAIILRTILQSTAYAAKVTESAISRVAADGHGFNQLDLQKVCRAALSSGFNRTGIVAIEDEDLVAASRQVRPSVLNTLEVGIPNVRWSDIGGSDEAKQVLQECVEWCLGKQQSIFAHLGLPPPKGVLLYGPPGCSKTMLAKALARESNMNFVSVKGPEVFSKWVGDSEKAVRDVFRQARAAAPCVVFIDELDGMCGHRGSGGVGDRVISQLLTELDGLPAASSKVSDSIIFVAATNRPENIDAAVLRPGRIDRKVYVGLPTVGERSSIAALHLSKVPCDTAAVTAEIVAGRTEGYTGAEVVAVCKEAAFQALSRSLKAERVEGSDMEAAFAKVRPRISEAEIGWYKRWGAERTS